MDSLKDAKIIIISHYSNLYGANRSLLNLIDGLAAWDIKNIIVVLPSTGAMVEELKRRKIKYYIIPFFSDIHVGNKNNFILKTLKLYLNWLLVFWYSNTLKGAKNTIIHTNSSATCIGAFFSQWMNVPHVWHIREFGFTDYKFKYNWGYKYFQSWLNKASAVIAISKSVYSERVADCRALQKVILYNGIILKKDVQERSEQKFETGVKTKFTFGIIGYLSAEKNQVEAIEAIGFLRKHYNNIELIIAGSGTKEYLQFLKMKMTELNIEDHINFIGFIEDTNKFYNSIDCLLMCSKNEALGRVTIEAMSFGIPVIGYNNAGTAEIIKNDYNGFLYEDGATDLAEKMQNFIADKTDLPTFKKNAIKTVEQNFTIEAYTEDIISIYKNCIN